jgi:Fur family iron response transcriptional regulator
MKTGSGLLRTVEIDPTRQFYDSTTSPHHHFYNVDTGELTDIPSGAANLTVTTQLPPGTREDGVDVVIRIRSA